MFVVLSIRIEVSFQLSKVFSLSSSKSYLQVVVPVLMAALVQRCVIIAVVVIIMIIVALVFSSQIPKAFT